MTTKDKLTDEQFVLSVNRAKLFDYLHAAKDTDEAMRIAGSRIITSLLSGDAGFAEMVVMEMAGIGFSPAPAPSDGLREAAQPEFPRVRRVREVLGSGMPWICEVSHSQRSFHRTQEEAEAARAALTPPADLSAALTARLDAEWNAAIEAAAGEVDDCTSWFIGNPDLQSDIAAAIRALRRAAPTEKKDNA